MNDLKDTLFETQRRKREKESEYKNKVGELKNIIKKMITLTTRSNNKKKRMAF